MRLFRRSFIAALGVHLAVAVAAAAFAGPASAADDDAFNADVTRAYGGYRSAVQYLRTGNPGMGMIELSGAVQDWTAVIEKYAAKPPAPYVSDKTFAATLKGIGDSMKDGIAKSEAGDAKAALESVVGIQETLRQLRKKSGVRLYSDCVTELNHQMDKLYVYRHHPPEPAKPESWKAVSADGLEYARLLADCRSLAPAAHKQNPDFVRMFDGARDSVDSLPRNIDAKNPLGIINVLRELRSFDRLIFYNWG